MILKKEKECKWKAYHYRKCYCLFYVNVIYVDFPTFLYCQQNEIYLCLFGYTLQFCNFESIFNTLLTISICCIKPPAKFPVNPLVRRWSLEGRFHYSKSNMRIFKYTYTIFYLHSFTFTLFLAGPAHNLSKSFFKWETVSFS